MVTAWLPRKLQTPITYYERVYEVSTDLWSLPGSLTNYKLLSLIMNEFMNFQLKKEHDFDIPCLFSREHHNYNLCVGVCVRACVRVCVCVCDVLCPVQVVSGGVASNQFLRSKLRLLLDHYDLSLHCPPTHLCTDNGVMIAW